VRNTVNKLGDSLNWDYHERGGSSGDLDVLSILNSEDCHTGVLILKIQSRREALHLTINSLLPRSKPKFRRERGSKNNRAQSHETGRRPIEA
jgi:hypothetical protein